MIFEMIGHSAFVLTLFAYLVKDIFWLRMLTISSGLTWLVYLFSKTEILWVSAYWNILFIAVNAVQVVLICKENRGVHFTEEEKDLYQTIFANFSPVEFMKLLSAGKWVDAKEGDTLIEEGRTVEKVMLICRGAVRVEANGKVKALLGNGQFIGEMSYLTADKASATVKANEPVRCLTWSHAAMQKILNRNPSLRFSFQSVLTSDLTKKLKE